MVAMFFFFRTVLVFLLVVLAAWACGQQSQLEEEDTSIPEVLMVSPADMTVEFGKGDLSHPPPIWALFSKEMNATTARSSIIVTTACNDPVFSTSDTPRYDVQTRAVTFQPLQLEADQQYVGRITQQAQDLLGNVLKQSVFFRFTTGGAIDNWAPISEGLKVLASPSIDTLGRKTNIPSQDILSARELILRWDAAVENPLDNGATPADKMEYLFYRASGDTCLENGVGFSAASQTLQYQNVCEPSDGDPNTPEKCEYRLNNLSADTQYCFAVRARDRGCRLDPNRRTAFAVTKPGGKLYVANLAGNNVLVFDNASEAENISPRVLRSNQTRLRAPLAALLDVRVPDPQNMPEVKEKTLYVANYGGNEVLAYDWGEGGPNAQPVPSGDVVPRLLGGGLAPMVGPVGLAMKSDDLYVTNIGSDRIRIFFDVSQLEEVTDPTQTRTIGVDTDDEGEEFHRPLGIALDTDEELMYVAYEGRDVQNIGSIAVMDLATLPPTAAARKPTWKISGKGLLNNNTRISRPAGLLLDRVDQDRQLLYVANREEPDTTADDKILVFDVSDCARGYSNRAPEWVIRSSAFAEPYMLSMIGDGSKKRLYVTNAGDRGVLVFDDIDAKLGQTRCQKNGALTPAEAIVLPQANRLNMSPDKILGGPVSQTYFTFGVAVENISPDLDTVYITSRNPLIRTFTRFAETVNVFENVSVSGGPTAVDPKPDALITGAIQGPTDVVVNTETGVLYVSNIVANSLSAFSAIDDPDTAGERRPDFHIFGKATGLNGPAGLALIPGDGTQGDRLLVANLFGNNILEFDIDQCQQQPKDCIPVSPPNPLSPDPHLKSPLGIAVHENKVFVSNRDNRDPQDPSDTAGKSVIVYQRADDGELSPLCEIQGGLQGPAGLHVSPALNELYVANRAANTVLVFDLNDPVFQGSCATPGANPLPVLNLSPIRALSPNPDAADLARLHTPNWVFLDTFSWPPKLYVSTRDTSRILVYNNADTLAGEASPGRFITPSSGLAIPTGFFLNPEK